MADPDTDGPGISSLEPHTCLRRKAASPADLLWRLVSPAYIKSNIEEASDLRRSVKDWCKGG